VKKPLDVDALFDAADDDDWESEESKTEVKPAAEIADYI